MKTQWILWMFAYAAMHVSQPALGGPQDLVKVLQKEGVQNIPLEMNEAALQEKYVDYFCSFQTAEYQYDALVQCEKLIGIGKIEALVTKCIQTLSPEDRSVLVFLMASKQNKRWVELGIEFTQESKYFPFLVLRCAEHGWKELVTPEYLKQSKKQSKQFKNSVCFSSILEVCAGHRWDDLIYAPDYNYVASIYDAQVREKLLLRILQKKKKLVALKPILAKIEEPPVEEKKSPNSEEIQSPSKNKNKNKNRNKKSKNNNKEKYDSKTIISQGPSIASYVGTELFIQSWDNRNLIDHLAEDIADLSALDDLVPDKDDAHVRNFVELWNNKEEDFFQIIGKKSQQNMEVFTDHIGHHFISSWVTEKLLGEKTRLKVKNHSKEWDCLSQTSLAMKEFLNDDERPICTAFLIPSEDQKISQSQQIAYLKDVLTASHWTEKGEKEGQHSVDYETEQTLLGLSIRKDQTGKILLESFETNTFTCVLQKNGNSLLTAYPLPQTAEQKLTKSMNEMHL